MMPTNTLYIVVGVLALLAIALFVISYFCFNDEDPDMDWYDNYQVAERPHVELHEQCSHTGETTHVVYWAAASIETIRTICDDCGETISTRIEN